jgi:hypothetical protein
MLWSVGFAAACFGWGRAMWQLLEHVTSTSTTTTTSASRRQDAFLLQQQQQQSSSSKSGVVAATVYDFRTPLARREEILLSSPQRGTTITADVRGNLGPANVMLTNSTSDWLKDRWQAASDMHGTAIQGRSHWVRLHFFNNATTTSTTSSTTPTTGTSRHPPVRMRLHQLRRIVLDWETAYAQDYRIDAFYQNVTMATVFDYNRVEDRSLVKTWSYGQSPGVQQKLPLHVIHEIPCRVPEQQPLLQQQHGYLDELLLTIRRPFHPGWGVSLWKIEVYGFDEDYYTMTGGNIATAIA